MRPRGANMTRDYENANFSLISYLVPMISELVGFEGGRR